MTVEEIEHAIEQLPPDKLAELATWFADYHAQVWDKQIEDDLDSGRLDKLLKEVSDEYTAVTMESVHVVVDIPRSALSIFRQEPDQFANEMRIAAAVKWYEMGLVAQSKASEVAGLSRAEFLAALTRFNVTPFQVDAEELIAEVQNA